MKTIAFWNQKGGTGKTTSAGNVAGELRHHGRTLLVDVDPQSNLTSWLAPEGIQYELADVLAGSVELRGATVTARPNLDILPSFAIGGELRTFAETRLPSKPFAFADLKAAADYDYMILDLAPGNGILERAALSIADIVVLVAAPEYFSSDGLESAEDFLSRIRTDLRAQFNATRLLINRINRSYAAHAVLLEEMRGDGYTVFEIGQSTGIHDAVMVHKTVWEYDPGNKYTAEYQRLAHGIL